MIEHFATLAVLMAPLYILISVTVHMLLSTPGARIPTRMALGWVQWMARRIVKLVAALPYFILCGLTRPIKRGGASNRSVRKWRLF
jgi:hypothetical protein